jgi:hypothetical protein
MSSIAAGTTLTTALVSTGDTTGELVLKTNGTTTAVTIDTSQNVAVVGQIVAAAGTVSLPSITTTGDVNTGIFFSAADTLVVTTGGTAAVTVDSGQRTKFPTTIGVGGATPSASGSGISFPATASASSDANTLDDYEEGSWTPAYGPETGAFTSIAYASFTGGSYTKIGNTVYVRGQIATDSITIGTAADTIRITGFPFAGSSTNASCLTMSTDQTLGWNTQHPCSLGVAGGLTLGSLNKRTSADGATSALNVNQMTTSGTNNRVFFAGSYTID